MTEQEYAIQKKAEFKEAAQAINEWKNLIGSVEWKKVIEYLEGRYIELDDEPSETLKALQSRNARMDEIRKLLKFIKHDFDTHQIRLRQLLEDRELIDEDVPTPAGLY